MRRNISLGWIQKRKFSNASQNNLNRVHTHEKHNKNCDTTSESSKQEIQQIDYKKKMTMIFTCNVCMTRSAKTFHKFTYQRGVVIVRCEACKTLHLVADHLGWFEGAQKTIEEILAAKGESVLRITDKNTTVDPNTLEIFPEHLHHTLPSHITVSSTSSKK
jgi:endonuclease/exonuclease/phosphatase family metal-dependent hydrolase